MLSPDMDFIFMLGFSQNGAFCINRRVERQGEILGGCRDWGTCSL